MMVKFRSPPCVSISFCAFIEYVYFREFTIPFLILFLSTFLDSYKVCFDNYIVKGYVSLKTDTKRGLCEASDFLRS